MGSKDPVQQSGQIQKVLIVLNPVSGVNDADEVRKTIATFCETSGVDCVIHETSPDEDLNKLIRDSIDQKVDCVLAAGGDGTVADVINGLMHSQVPLGILPLGTGNAVARALNIPLDLEDALELISSDKRALQSMDVMQVGDTYFVLNVSIGVSADTMHLTGREEKQKFGMLAYLRRAIESVSNAHLYRFTVEVDGRKISFSASEVMITNDKFMGMQPRLEGVDIEADDGHLDMFIVRAKTLFDYVGVMGRFIFPAKQKDEQQLKHISIRETALITSEPPLRVQADGDVIGDTPIELQVVPDGLRVIVPHSEKKK